MVLPLSPDSSLLFFFIFHPSSLFPPSPLPPPSFYYFLSSSSFSFSSSFLLIIPLPSPGWWLDLLRTQVNQTGMVTSMQSSSLLQLWFSLSSCTSTSTDAFVLEWGSEQLSLLLFTKKCVKEGRVCVCVCVCVCVHAHACWQDTLAQYFPSCCDDEKDDYHCFFMSWCNDDITQSCIHICVRFSVSVCAPS